MKRWHMQFIVSQSQGRTSHEVRGLKHHFLVDLLMYYCRTSHEVRGLKHGALIDELHAISRTSHEVRGLKLWMWTEMEIYSRVAPHTRCVD